MSDEERIAKLMELKLQKEKELQSIIRELRILVYTQSGIK